MDLKVIIHRFLLVIRLSSSNSAGSLPFTAITKKKQRRQEELKSKQVGDNPQSPLKSWSGVAWRKGEENDNSQLSCQFSSIYF